VLAQAKRAQERDGLLDARAIYGLNLHSDLVFLSACRSGVGKISNDGVMGLTRAFLYAGAASVIVSLWDVADEPTSRLVVEFYKNWLNGQDKASSLRQAQLHLLRDLRAGRLKIRSETGELVLPEDPVFWASFVVEGEP
jgi:CHAT domain-containing protein